MSKEVPYYIKREGESDQEHWKRMQTHIRAEKVNRQRQVDEGYTYYDQLMEFHSNPENRTDLALKIDKMVDKVKGGFNNLGESLASKLIGQDPVTNYIPQPKAHEAIDEEINKFEIGNIPQEHKDLLMGLVMGTGGGGLGRTGGNIIQKILTKIKARNARSLRNLRQGQGTGAQSMSSADRGFLNKEWEVWNKLKDLIK